ncbi:MAG: hypothetical protein CMC93_06015 [Flavobacteriaceae bacterium]|nr:hypothetical protein [Flavobacteriaceae bacterium]
MKKYVLAGASFALLSVILGAFASHALKPVFEAEVLASYQTGIRYMMYHGLTLLILSQIPILQSKWIFRMFFWGIIFFSFSIFILCVGKLTPVEFSCMGPITPIGGSLLILGWILLIKKTIQS